MDFVRGQALSQLHLLAGGGFFGHLVFGSHPIEVICLVWTPPSVIRVADRAQMMLSQTSLEQNVWFGASEISDKTSSVRNDI